MDRLRFTLICMLALALPVQGYAAQTMIFCGPGHHQSPDSSEHTTHERAIHEHQHAHADAADETAPETASALHDEGKCSVCAACCNPVAIVPSITNIEYPHLTPPDIAGHFEPLIGLTAGGLERPPRPSLA